MKKDYYDILGIKKGAGEDEIKSAFRKMAHKYHPDKKGGDEARFKEASEAYSVLSDKKKRAEYDTYGKSFAGAGGFSAQGGPASGWDFSGFQGGFQGQGGQAFEFDLGDIFGDIFGGGATRQANRGRDISIDIELTFKESVFGATRDVLITKVGTCDTCAGSGAKPGTKTKTCATCNGKGDLRETRNTMFGNITTNRVCETCHGTGQVPETPCETCRGAGVVRKQEEIHVEVPAGVSNGEMIRMPGRGEAASGGDAGDLYVKLHVKQDTAFSREGNNLLMSLPIKLSDALLGSNYSINTLDGTQSLDVPVGVTHGEVLRIKGKGVPHGRSRGDLLVRIDIQFPKKLSKNAQKLVQELRSEGL